MFQPNVAQPRCGASYIARAENRENFSATHKPPLRFMRATNTSAHFGGSGEDDHEAVHRLRNVNVTALLLAYVPEDG